MEAAARPEKIMQPNIFSRRHRLMTLRRLSNLFPSLETKAEKSASLIHNLLSRSHAQFIILLKVLSGFFFVVPIWLLFLANFAFCAGDDSRMCMFSEGDVHKADWLS